MNFLRIPPGSRIIVRTFILVALLAIRRSSSHSHSSAFISDSLQMACRASDPIAGLEVSLHQSSTSPPTITTTVTNNNDHPITFLVYGSPLDSLALQLGLFSITAAGASQALELPTVQVNRLWPPKPDSLVTIAPGASEKEHVVLEEPRVPMDKVGRRASVKLAGKWQAVWVRTKDDITEEALERIHSSSEVYSGNFASSHLEFSVD